MMSRMTLKNYMIRIGYIGMFCACSLLCAMERPPTLVPPEDTQSLQLHDDVPEAVKRLFDACLNDDDKEIKVALSAGAPIEARSHDGKTALYMAASCNNCMALGALLAEGADPEALCTERNETALQRAFAQDHPKIIEILLVYGACANSDHIDAAMLDPFFRATILNNGMVNSISYLKQSMKLSEKMKSKALCYAAGRCHIDAVTRWILFSADPFVASTIVNIIKQRTGLSPVRKRRYAEIAELLEQQERGKAMRHNGARPKTAE